MVKVDIGIKFEVKILYLDLVKNLFVKNDLVIWVDSFWMNELISLDIYDDLIKDI